MSDVHVGPCENYSKEEDSFKFAIRPKERPRRKILGIDGLRSNIIVMM